MITDTKHDVPQPAKQDLSEEVFEKYDLFNTEETATLYSKHQPHLDQTVVDTVLAVVPNRDLLVDVGLCLSLFDRTTRTYIRLKYESRVKETI